MKGSYLGEFQEIVLLAVLVLDDNAYGVAIQEELGRRIGRNISRGALHSALSRLEAKSFLESEMGGATAERGGRQKRFYFLTNLGKKALVDAEQLRRQFYNSLPGLSLDFSM
ncbi:helix-turn-helix transcriptional regulator [Fulvivirgaceae bacterium BMA12]|uniref:Helix-turn-helix transcriptional regulator n=1 Tax=Agaribacillus aureus TaxID=3051825 RepID=A0ABT8L6S8_9BACT|nr:helix-turn-helix transcriptional regulator [Fulvivirgaceae bacterium BMA12]